jgi:hypothetical protein
MSEWPQAAEGGITMSILASALWVVSLVLGVSGGMICICVMQDVRDGYRRPGQSWTITIMPALLGLCLLGLGAFGLLQANLMKKEASNGKEAQVRVVGCHHDGCTR